MYVVQINMYIEDTYVDIRTYIHREIHITSGLFSSSCNVSQSASACILIEGTQALLFISGLFVRKILRF